MENSLGKLFERARKKRRWTQEKLASETGVSVQTIYRIENNREGVTDDTRRHVAEVLGLNLDETQPANHEGLVATTPQTSHVVSARGNTAADTPQEASGMAPSPSPIIDETSQVSHAANIEPKPDYRWLIISVSAIIIVVLAVIGGIVYWALIGKNIYNTISGQVTCPNNQRVVGIYIVAVSGGSYHVNYRQYLNSSQSVAKFTYVLPDDGAYNLHVGCGGTASNWAKSYNTEACSGPINDRDFHALIAYDQLPADRSKPCLVWVKQ